jgi:hypothetical protein
MWRVKPSELVVSKARLGNVEDGLAELLGVGEVCKLKFFVFGIED